MPAKRKYNKKGQVRYKRADHYAASKIQAAIKRALNKNIETKSGLISPFDGTEIAHNNFVTISSNLLATKNGTQDNSDGLGNRIGDKINLKGVSIKFMCELNERYSDVTFRMMVVRSAKDDPPTRSTMFNGVSGNKMIDTLNRERYTFLFTKTFKIKSNAPTAAMNGTTSMNTELTFGAIGDSGLYNANGTANPAATSRYTKIIKTWIPGKKFSRTGVIQYESDGSQQVKFFDYHLVLYAYSNYSTNQDVWNVARLNDAVIQQYYKDA